MRENLIQLRMEQRISVQNIQRTQAIKHRENKQNQTKQSKKPTGYGTEPKSSPKKEIKSGNEIFFKNVLKLFNIIREMQIKTDLRFHLVPGSVAILREPMRTHTVKDVGTGTLTLTCHYAPIVLPLGGYSRIQHPSIVTCSSRFTIDLLTVTTNSSQSRYPPVKDGWIPPYGYWSERPQPPPHTHPHPCQITQVLDIALGCLPQPDVKLFGWKHNTLQLQDIEKLSCN